MNKNKSYSNEFKFKVALEMIRGDFTLAEIISKYQVPRSVLSRWKRQLLDHGPEIFQVGTLKSTNEHSADIEKLHATIGRLKVENDFLQLVSTKLRL